MKTRINIQHYIKQSHNKVLNEAKERYLYNEIIVLQKDFLQDNIDLNFVLKYVESRIPFNLVRLVDAVYIGQFDELINRELDAKYENNAIYLTNYQMSNEDMIDDIIHEIAHAAEELYLDNVYGDGLIEQEFKGKRTRLYYLLKEEGFNVDLNSFEDISYSIEFDNLLYKEIGYPILANLTSGLFVSPYGATSIREYFANAFEHYFLNDLTSVKLISPTAYDKIQELLELGGM